jgi:hypothetical protein
MVPAVAARSFDIVGLGTPSGAGFTTNNFESACIDTHSMNPLLNLHQAYANLPYIDQPKRFRAAPFRLRQRP